jgi:OmpA-OmpF porin, OOP family
MTAPADAGGTGGDFRLSALRAPPTDRDGDGLADADDKCPDLPGGSQGGRAGCPGVVYARVSGRQIQLLQPIAFKPNGDQILPRSRPVLDQVSAVLRSRRSMRVEVQGHYKPPGYSMRLSHRRAQAVQRYLVRKGIAISRVEAKGYGETRPLALPHTAAGRARNRRIEIQILHTETP